MEYNILYEVLFFILSLLCKSSNLNITLQFLRRDKIKNKITVRLEKLCLVWFYSISTFEGYLMLNLHYTHILNIFVNMICKHILLITFLNDPKFILLCRVKWFQVLLCITNNSIKHQSFVYTQLNHHTDLFLTTEYKSFVCTQFKCQTVLFDP